MILVVFSIVVILSAVFLSGCAAIGVASGLNFGNISDTVIFKTLPDDMLATGIDVANSMGFRVTSRDMVQKMVLLEYGNLGSFSNPLVFLIGKIDNSYISLTVLDARSLSVQVKTTGTFGSGDYNDAVRLLEEFKRRIYTRIIK